VAQAQAEELAVVTGDAVFRKYGVRVVWSADQHDAVTTYLVRKRGFEPRPDCSD
jgi:hypothetical protein